MANIIFSTAIDNGAEKGINALRAKASAPLEIKFNNRSLSQPLGRITGDVSEFTKSLSAASARVVAFGATSGAIYAVAKAISFTAKSVVEVDKELTELNTFLGVSAGQIKQFGNSLFDVAKDTASSFKDTATAAKEFARQGLSMEETLKRTSDALKLSRISGLGAEAVSYTHLTLPTID
jgi:phage-related minor tail protein